METGETADIEARAAKIAEKMADCPKRHNDFVQNGGWKSHTTFCMCNCSYCQEARLRNKNPESA